MRTWCFIGALLYSLCALAQDNAAAIKAALAALNAEQQTVYQQFQMLRSLREQAALSAVAPPQPGPPQNYEELVQQRQAATDQANRYQSDMDALYDRYKRIDEEKQPLLLRLRELALQPAPPRAATPKNPPSARAPAR